MPRKNKQMVIPARYVEDRNSNTRHDYYVKLTVEDMAALITILGQEVSASAPNPLRDALCAEAPALVKLLACANGLMPTPMPGTKAPATKQASQCRGRS